MRCLSLQRQNANEWDSYASRCGTSEEGSYTEKCPEYAQSWLIYLTSAQTLGS